MDAPLLSSTNEDDLAPATTDAQTLRDKESVARLSGYSDAIFAIALTILAVPLKLEDEEETEAEEDTDGTCGHDPSTWTYFWMLWCSGLMMTLLQFFVAFCNILLIWMEHSIYFEHLRKVTSFDGKVNIVLLLAVACVPFSMIVLPLLPFQLAIVYTITLVRALSARRRVLREKRDPWPFIAAKIAQIIGFLVMWAGITFKGGIFMLGHAIVPLLCRAVYRVTAKAREQIRSQRGLRLPAGELYAMPSRAHLDISAERFNQLTDGLYAIAATLIILEVKTTTLVAPDGVLLWIPNHGIRDAYYTFYEALPEVLVFFLVFSLLSTLWTSQHDVLVDVDHLERAGKKALLLYWLHWLFICLVPFGVRSAVITHNEVSMLILSFILMICGLTVVMLWRMFPRAKTFDQHTVVIQAAMLPLFALLGVPFAFVSFWVYAPLVTVLPPTVAWLINRRRRMGAIRTRDGDRDRGMSTTEIPVRG